MCRTACSLRASAPAVRVVGGLVAALVLLFAASPLSAQPTIQYAYDALGRLIAVVDQNGNVGVYNYDAVGNLLSIQRVDGSVISGAVGITLVVPVKGKVGTTVQIFGKGFSATASQNTVSFNGTSAPVAAATTSTSTSVPSGAVSGPITVSTPLGTATSSTAFGVLGAISVSPATATVGTNGTEQFAAQEAGSPTTNVNWAVNAIVSGNQTVGTITTAGLYTAPLAAPPLGTAQVTATSKDDTTLSGSATVTILTPQPVFAVSGPLSVGLNQVPQTFDRNVTARVSVGVNQVPQTFDKSVTGSRDSPYADHGSRGQSSRRRGVDRRPDDGDAGEWADDPDRLRRGGGGPGGTDGLPHGSRHRPAGGRRVPSP